MNFCNIAATFVQLPREVSASDFLGLRANPSHQRMRRVSGGKAWRLAHPLPSSLLPSASPVPVRSSGTKAIKSSTKNSGEVAPEDPRFQPQPFERQLERARAVGTWASHCNSQGCRSQKQRSVAAQRGGRTAPQTRNLNAVLAEESKEWKKEPLLILT